MSKWITKRLPKEKTNVLVCRLFEDGTEDIRIGYLKHPAGVKSEYYFVVPMYEGEYSFKQYKKWDVIGWQKLPKTINTIKKVE